MTDLRHRGDADPASGPTDLAVDVRAGPPPAWLTDVLRPAVRDPGTCRASSADLAAILGGTTRPRCAADAVPAGLEEIR